MIGTIIGFFVSQLSTFIPIIVGVLGLVGALFGMKRMGAKAERAEIEAKHYKEAANAERQRGEASTDAAGMSDAELERLRSRYSSD